MPNLALGYVLLALAVALVGAVRSNAHCTITPGRQTRLVTEASLTGMSKAKVNWVFLALIVMLGLVLITAKPFPRPKTRASRIHSVNSVAHVFITLPKTNALPANARDRKSEDHAETRGP